MWVKNLNNRHAVSLRRLFPFASFVGCADIHVVAASENSKTCRDGCLFAAIPGTRVNGQHFIPEAIHRGATSLLCEQPHPNAPISQCIVPDVRSSFARLCQSLAGLPSQRLKTIGVTGTNGKTTTTYLIRSILSAASHQTGMMGTIEYHDGTAGEPSHLTTPDAPAFAQWLSRMVANQTTHAAFEISSHALHQGRTAGVDLDVAVITNITHDHLDYHDTFAAYKACKSRIIEHCKPNAAVVLNHDDQEACSLRSAIPPNHQVITYGLTSAADIYAASVRVTLTGSQFMLHADKEAVLVDTKLVGHHNVENCLAAAAATYALGVSPETISRGISRLVNVPGRMEAIERGQDYRIFVDYAHTDDALRRCIQTIKPLTDNRLICVFGAGGDRDRTKRPLFASATREADLVILTSDNPRSEDPRQIIEDILAGYQDNRPEIQIEPNRDRAIQLAIEYARVGDTILVAGKGHEDYQIIGTQRLDFDDRDVIQKHLARKRILLSA